MVVHDPDSVVELWCEFIVHVSIEFMFKKQDEVLADFMVTETTSSPTSADGMEAHSEHDHDDNQAFAAYEPQSSSGTQAWDDDQDQAGDEDGIYCPICDQTVPSFASTAHERYHALEN